MSLKGLAEAEAAVAWRERHAWRAHVLGHGSRNGMRQNNGTRAQSWESNDGKVKRRAWMERHESIRAVRLALTSVHGETVWSWWYFEGWLC